MADQGKYEIVIKGKDEYSSSLNEAGVKTEELSNNVNMLGAAITIYLGMEWIR